MLIKTFIFIALLLLSFSRSQTETVTQDTSKSLLFKVFDIEDKEIRKFGSGYIFDRIFRRREFHHPINFIPIELQYGFSTNISKNYLFSYESDVKGYEGTLLGHQLDVDIMKTNLAYYLFRNSWLDMHSGLNLRYASLLLPSKIPEEWNASQNSWLLDAKFKGSVMELAWSQSLILQWFESWYTTYRYTYGIASSKFYKNQNNLSGYGPSQSFSFGARYIFDPGMENRFSVGLDFNYKNT